MDRKIAWGAVAAFVAFTVAVNALYYYADNSSSVGIRKRERIKRLVDWYPLIVLRPG